MNRFLLLRGDERLPVKFVLLVVDERLVLQKITCKTLNTKYSLNLLFTFVFSVEQ